MFSNQAERPAATGHADAGQHDRLAARQPVDADVEETADDRAEQAGDDRGEPSPSRLRARPLRLVGSGYSGEARIERRRGHRAEFGNGTPVGSTGMPRIAPARTSGLPVAPRASPVSRTNAIHAAAGGRRSRRARRAAASGRSRVAALIFNRRRLRDRLPHLPRRLPVAAGGQRAAASDRSHHGAPGASAASANQSAAAL